MKDYYDILQVSHAASVEVIRASYRTLSKKVHPDLNGGDATAFNVLTEAHDCLTNSSRRAVYDRSIKTPQQPPQGRKGKRVPVVDAPTSQGIEALLQIGELFLITRAPAEALPIFNQIRPGLGKLVTQWVSGLARIEP